MENKVILSMNNQNTINYEDNNYRILLQILLDENNSNKIRENILQYIDNTFNIRINDKKINKIQIYFNYVSLYCNMNKLDDKNKYNIDITIIQNRDEWNVHMIRNYLIDQMVGGMVYKYTKYKLIIIIVN